MSGEVWGQRESDFDIKGISNAVKRHFVVYEAYPQPQAVGIAIQMDPKTLEEPFEELRRDLLDMGYVPSLVQQDERVFIHVVKRSNERGSFRILKVLLMLVTTLSVTVSGMLFVSSYEDIAFGSWETVWRSLVFFLAPLMMILAIHEIAHFLVAKRHGVALALPYVIPSYPITGIFGTVISIPGPVPSRRSMIDIGIIGPAAGFGAAVLVTMLGLILTASDPHPVGDDASSVTVLGIPLIYRAIHVLIPVPDDTLIHPTTFVGWVGFMVTFFVLLPIGTLDGGYVARAILRDRVKWVGRITLAAIVVSSLVSGYWGYIGLVIILLLFMLVWKVPAPLNDVSPLPRNRWFAGIASLIMLILCFTPSIFVPADIDQNIEVDFEVPEVHVAVGSSVNNTLMIYNTGNTQVDVSLRLLQTHGWYVAFDERVEFRLDLTNWSEPFTVARDKSSNFTTLIDIEVWPPGDAEQGDMVDFVVEVLWHDAEGISQTHSATFRAVVGWIEFLEVPEDAIIAQGAVESFDVSFRNLVTAPLDGTTTYQFSLSIEGGMVHTLAHRSDDNLTAQEVANTLPITHMDMENNATAELRIWVHAPEGFDEPSALVVLLVVHIPDQHVSRSDITFQLTVFDPILDIVLTSTETDWNFRKGEEKHVTFHIKSHANINATVHFSYALNNTDAFWPMQPLVEETVLSPNEFRILVVNVLAKGDGGDDGTLTVDILYGDGQSGSASTALHIIEA